MVDALFAATFFAMSPSHIFPIVFQNFFLFLLFVVRYILLESSFRPKSEVLILKTTNLDAFFSEWPVSSHRDYIGQQECFIHTSYHCHLFSK